MQAAGCSSAFFFLLCFGAIVSRFFFSVLALWRCHEHFDKGLTDLLHLCFASLPFRGHWIARLLVVFFSYSFFQVVFFVSDDFRG